MRRGLIKSRTPPEWNVRVLTEDDFYQYCDEARVIVRETQLEKRGLYMPIDGVPHIFLNDTLRGVERLYISFHELAHHWLHPPGIQMFHAFRHITETEADIVAACALIPATVLTHYWPTEIAEIYGYPHRLVTLRCEVHDRYKI